MRIYVSVATICLIYSVFLFVPVPKGNSYPAPGLAEWSVALLYVPVMLAAVALLIAGIVNLFRGKNRRTWIFCIVMCLPACVSLGQTVVSQRNRTKSSSWPQIGMFLRDRLLEYYEAHPERFHYIGEDEEVEVDGFGDYVDTKKQEIDSALRPYLVMRSGKVLDPWGERVRLGLDRSHDGYILIAGKHVITDNVNPPRLDYRVALVVILGRPADENDLGPQVGRK